MFRSLLAASLLFMPAAARAEWREAVSGNFIVYSQGGEQSLREAVTKLEKYDFLLRFASNAKTPSKGIKLKVYLMRNMEAVQETLPYQSSTIAGYYSATTRGPIAVGTRTATGGRNGLPAETILLHEIAHHFMFQHFPATYPAWYIEGFAEFYGTTKILENDVVEVGHSAPHRYASFEGNQWLPLSKMLTAKSYSDIGGNNLHLMYAQGWLLVHYLSTNRERSGQLAKYLNLLNRGTDFRTAMDEAFGPGAKKLDDELRDYAGKWRINAIRLPFKPINVGPIEVRVLSPAEEALVKSDIVIGRGVLISEAHNLARTVRREASRHPQDPYAHALLTETERAAGNHEAAVAAVERWLAAEPGSARARMHKAELQMEALSRARSADPAAWEKARQLLIEGLKRVPRDPMILEAYYDSFLSQGVSPPLGAQNALVKAFDLVPQDDDLRYKVAADFEMRNMIEDAIMIIKPAAFLLDEEENARDKAQRERAEDKYREIGKMKRETARAMLARLEAKLAVKSR